MRSNKAITLTSLIIYVIGMVIVVSTIATITSFFYKNIDIKNINDDTTTQYTKFISIFSDEINKSNNKIVECKITEENGEKISYIIFSSGNQYTFKNKSIYRNKIKICDNVEDCDFSYTYIDSTYRIKVNYKSANINMTGDNAIVYVLR